MRRRRVALAVLATAALSLLMAGLAGSAAAGGPTSVLLVVPGEGRTASLYVGSPDYEQLASLLDAYDTPNGSATPPVTANDAGASGTIDASGPGVTLAWLIHDVQVWRVDRVYLNADGGPWISTQTSLNGGDIWAKPPTWHVAAQAKRLATLLDRLGVGPTTGPGSSSATPTSGNNFGTIGPASSQQPHAVSAAAKVNRSSGVSGPDGWIWGVAGVVLGAVLTLVARRSHRPQWHWPQWHW